MRFLIDMPLSAELVDWLLQRGHEAVHAMQIGLDRVSDEALVARARQENRVIITADLDFPRMLALMDAEGPGLILLRGGNYSEAEMRHLLERVLQTVAIDELPRSVVVVDRRRIRRRSLPIRPNEGS
jgi:predicted nuclease of predicted toxin-antitoxin system